MRITAGASCRPCSSAALPPCNGKRRCSSASRISPRQLLARGFPPDKLVVHPLWGGDSILQDSGRECAAEGKEVLFAGRFVEKKGAAVLIEAMRLLDAVRPPASRHGRRRTDSRAVESACAGADRQCRIRRLAAQCGIAAADARGAGRLRAEPRGSDGDAEGLPNMFLRRWRKACRSSRPGMPASPRRSSTSRIRAAGAARRPGSSGRGAAAACPGA